MVAAASTSAFQAQEARPTPEFDYVFIGLVEKPGQYEWRENLTVREAVAEAGGRARGADSTAVFFRIGPDRTQIPARLEDRVRPRDVLFIPRAGQGAK
jgi:protein involved in polysaccharide export with SLBB domain